ncbi:MAG: serine/threonine protein kinase [Ktedonobacteraceae bacterium]|nr:serine/threonine protein kinase [Ktedonobacteraceae bacterium]
MLKEQMTLPRGFTIRDPAGNRYMIEGILGKGGSSAVYLVRERSDKQQVFALKEVIDPDRREREHFIFEWEVLKRLKHPALPQVYYVFEHQRLRRVYILMSYIKGSDLERLRAWQPNKRFSLPMVLALMSPVVSAVSYLHDQDPPVVHRDIKPSNIIVPTGGDEAVLVDFSIAKEYVPNGTTTAIRHGSPGYAAPEQYGTGTTPLTDVYGLGATLYTLLTGAIPTDALTRLTESKTDPLRSVKELVPDIPPGVSEVVKRAMSLNREDRFPNVEQLWQMFREAADEKQASSAEITELTTGALPDIRLRPIEEITTAFTPKNGDIPVVRGRKAPLVLSVVLLAAVLASGLLYFSFYSRYAASHPGALSTTVARPTHSLSPTSLPTLLPTPVPTLSPYPQLAKAYDGTIADYLSNTKTPLKLSNIQEVNNKFNGSFQGLGLNTPFNGHVDEHKNIYFTIPYSDGTSTLAFTGHIQLGGTVSGVFIVLNQYGQKTGEDGQWEGIIAQE